MTFRTTILNCVVMLILCTLTDYFGLVLVNRVPKYEKKYCGQPYTEKPRIHFRVFSFFAK